MHPLAEDPAPTPSGRDELASGLAALASVPLLVLTGAGVSVASGIPSFRGADPGAVWSRDVTELATRRFFERDPVASWRWYLERFATLEGAVPNAAHRALVDLEAWQRRRGGFLLVTQNIDTLHRAAGSTLLVEVHGSADLVRCSRAGCANAAPTGLLPRSAVDLAPFLADPTPATLPRCPRCRSPLRPHVLWFDEHYGEHETYQIERVVEAAQAAGALLFVGTSFAVGITALVVEQGLLRHIPMWSIDPGATAPPHRRIRGLTEPAEALLPAVVERLGTA